MQARFKLKDAQAAYDIGDYSGTLSTLDEADKMLGKQTPQSLYLRIMTEYKSVNLSAMDNSDSLYSNIKLLQALKANTTTYMKNNMAADNEDKAYEIYRISEELKNYYSGNPDNDAGIIAYKKSDTTAAVAAFTKAANTGDAIGMFYLGYIAYYKGDYSTFMRWMQKAANKGNANAMLYIGVVYNYGLYGSKGIQKDYTQAMQWLQKAAGKANPAAMWYIGNMYYSGSGIQQDYTQAIQWYQKAADRGRADAMSRIGDMYYLGHGIQQDYVLAMQWWQKAAGKENTTAMINIGNVYYSGQGVQQNYTQALQWYQKAADKGDAYAMNNIGNMYYLGSGIQQDYIQAMQWFQKAADKGNSDAMINIGNMYPDWIDYNIDNKVSVKLPAEPTRINDNTVMAATKDSTSCIITLDDFQKTANLDSARLSLMLPTKEFADGIKNGMLENMPGFTLGEIKVGKLNGHYTYTIEGGNPTRKLKCYSYMVVIGKDMYSLSAVMSDKKAPKDKDKFFASLNIH